MNETKTFHVDDIVGWKTSDSDLLDAVGFVDRTHGDVESHEPMPAGSYGVKIHRSKSLSRVAFKQFMKDGVPPKGFALVQWQTHPKTELVAEKDLILLDRPFLAGDIVRKDDPSDDLTGTIVSVRKSCTLLTMCEVKELKSGKSMRAAWLPPPEDDEPPLLELSKEGTLLRDIPANELKFVQQYNEGDLIIYRNWLGRVRECFDEITVRLSDNGVVTLKNDLDVETLNGIPEERLSVGSLIKTKKGSLRTGLWRFGAYNPNITPVGVVVDVQTQEIQVDWLQCKLGDPDPRTPYLPAYSMPEAILTQDELESGNVHIYDLTKRPDVPEENVVRTKVMSDPEMASGQRVRFKDATSASVKYDGSEPDLHGKFDRVDRRETLGYDMNVFTLVSMHTEVDVQWNDLSLTTEPSTKLYPDFAVDDEDAVFPGEVVCTNEQTSDGPVGTIKPVKVGVVQEANTSDRIARVRWTTAHSLSFLETTYTTPVPFTTIGTLQEESEEVSFYDIKAPESVNRRRGDFVLLPDDLPGNFESGSIHWLGEVVDVELNGRTVIRLGSAEPVREISMPTETTVLAFRGTDLDDADHDHSAMDEDDMSFGSGSDDLEFLDEDYDMDDEEAGWFVSGHPGMPVDDEDDSWSTESEGDIHEPDPMETNVEVPPLPTPEVAPPIISETQPIQPSARTAAEIRDIANEQMDLSSFQGSPVPYDILETSVPVNHPFAHCISASSSGHMRTVQREHKILRMPSALPSNIYVRTWESRLDLIRVLFVGSVGTPYEYAPFMVDLFLGPNFPIEPPAAHFHSWASEGTGMQGRVNPNLYEDGKICLSLLGTWSGDETKGEGWVSGKSTVLQILVSILGLVLVKEPYYSKSFFVSSRYFIRRSTSMTACLQATATPLMMKALRMIMCWLYRFNPVRLRTSSHFRCLSIDVPYS